MSVGFEFDDEFPPNVAGSLQKIRTPDDVEPINFITTTEHTVYRTPRGERIIDGYNLDVVGSTVLRSQASNTERALVINFGSVAEAERIFSGIFDAPVDPETGEKIIPSEFGAVSVLKSNLTIEDRAQFREDMKSKTRDASRQATRNRLPAGKTSRFTRPSNTEGSSTDNNVDPPLSTVEPSVDEDEQLQPSSPDSLALNDKTYGNIVNGWNEKINANNVKISSLIPFAELYVVFDQNDIVFSGDTNKFSGIKNRVSNIKFIGNKDGLLNTNGEVPAPVLPKGLSPNAKIAKIGATKSQLQSDYANEYGATEEGNVYVSSDTRTYKGQPGITDVSVSRASGGAFNIKYDVNITLPNPEIVNDQYEYSKLLLLNSTFLLIHGWNVTDSDFSADSYPPNFVPGNTEAIEVSLNSSNNGYWSASLVSLYDFSFEFDNVGHLVGKLRFLTSQGAFMSAVSTDQVATPILNKLKEVPEEILQRVSGDNLKEKQTFVFSNGVPWSRADISGNDNVLEAASIEESLRIAYQQLNDTQLESAASLDESYFDGIESGEVIYTFDRYKTVSEKVEKGVSDAANAMRAFFRIFSREKYRGGSTNANVDEFIFGINIDRGVSQQSDSRLGALVTIGLSQFNGLSDSSSRQAVQNFIFPNTIDARFITIDDGDGGRYPTVDSEGQDAGDFKFFGSFTNRESFSSNRDDKRLLTTDPFTDRDGEQDLRNYYYNNILMNIAKNDEDLAFVPPAGFRIDEDGAGVLLPILGVGEATPDRNSFEQKLRTMGRGSLIDEQLKNLVPEGSFEKPSIETMPNFGQTLQSEIFSNFTNPENLNNHNLSRNNVDAEGNHRVLDQQVFLSARNSSVLSVPTLVTRPTNPTVPAISITPEEALANKDVLMVIYLVRKVRPDKNEDGVDIDDTRIYKIEFPNGPEERVNNVYNLINEHSNEEDITVAEELGRKATLQIFTPENGEEVQENKDQRIGANDFFLVRKTYVMNNGYFIFRQRGDAQQDFVDLPPRALKNGDDFFIPDIRTLLGNDEVDDSIKGIIETLLTVTNDQVEISAPIHRKQYGSAANVSVSVRNIEYDVIMRPTYFYLGSVLEALSKSLGKTVKFFYRALPSRATGQSVTIPIPANAVSDVIKEVKTEIFNKNLQICKLGGLPVGANRYDFIGDLQTEDQEEQGREAFVQSAIQWFRDFSLYMELVLEDGNFGFQPELGDDDDQFFYGLKTRIIEVDTGGMNPGDDTSTDVGRDSSQDFSTTTQKRNSAKNFEEFANLIRTQFEGIQNSSYSEDNGEGNLIYNFFLRQETETSADESIPAGVYQISGARNDIIKNFMNRDGLASNLGQQFPNINANLQVASVVLREDIPKVERLQQQVQALIDKQNDLGFETAFSSLEVKTTFELPVEIATVEQILMQEGAAPTHSLLKKLLAAASDAMPQLRLSMRTHSIDPSYIDVFVNAINVDGVIQEVFNEIEASDLVVEGADSIDQFRRSVQREGQYLKSNKVMVCNFGTMDSLVENFQMSSKVDPNAFAAHRLPTIMGGVSMDVSNILQGNDLEQTGILNDIKRILESGPVGGANDLKELQIIREVHAEGSGQTSPRLEVDDTGLSNLQNLLTNNTEPIMRKTAQSFVEDLMSQDVTLYNKIRALQGEYFNGLTESTNTSGKLEENERFAGSRFFGNILNTYLRTVTLTIHGTTNLNVFNYIYLKGLLSGVEGLYIINSVNESVTPTTFTTTLECKLVEYTENREEKNPLAYRGEGSIRRFAEINRGLRLNTGNTDATISEIDFSTIVAKAKNDDGYTNQ